MRYLLVLFLLAASTADQGGLLIQNSHTTESLRGVSAVSRTIIWASGTHGTYLRTTDGGATWTSGQVPDASALDFRGIVAFSADEAFLMSSGTGELSKIYHTADAGAHWQLQLLNANPKGFLDSIAFWDRTHGIALGDPVPDDAGTLKFEILVTEDGKNWSVAQTTGMPAAMEGEGAFAASNTCIAVLPGGSDVWFATGGKVARVFHSADRGKSWTVANSPIAHGPESAGIFSIAFRDAQHGVIAGGDYKRPDEDGPNLARTADGGKTWTLSALHPQEYFSAVAYDRGDRERMLILGQDFVSTFHSPADTRRVSAVNMKLNAISAFPEGGAAVVGARGAIAIVP